MLLQYAATFPQNHRTLQCTACVIGLTCGPNELCTSFRICTTATCAPGLPNSTQYMEKAPTAAATAPNARLYSGRRAGHRVDRDSGAAGAARSAMKGIKKMFVKNCTQTDHVSQGTHRADI